MHKDWTVSLKYVILGLIAQSVLAVTLVSLQYTQLARHQWDAVYTRVEAIRQALQSELSSSIIAFDRESIRVVLRAYAQENFITYISFNSAMREPVREVFSIDPTPGAPSVYLFSRDTWESADATHLVTPVTWAGHTVGNFEMGISAAAAKASIFETIRKSVISAMLIMSLFSFAWWRFARGLAGKWHAFANWVRGDTAHAVAGVDVTLDYVRRHIVELRAQANRAHAEVRTLTHTAKYLWSMVNQCAVLTLSKQGKITGWNAGAQVLLGYTEQEILGRQVDNLFYGELRVAGVFWQMLERADADRLALEESQWVHKNGAAVPVRLELVVRRDSEGKVLGYMFVVVGLSAQPDAAKIWKKRCQELYALLQERNIELDFVKQHAAGLQQSHQAFIARLSQELRIPANTILGYTQLLEGDKRLPLPGYQQRNVREIMSAGGQLLNSIGELLEHTKIEHGGQGLLVEYVAFAPLLQECVSTVQNLVKYREVNIMLADSLDISLTVHADRTRLAHALVNVLLTLSGLAKPGQALVIKTLIDEQRVKVLCGVETAIKSDFLPPNRAMSEDLCELPACAHKKYNFSGIKTLLEMMGGGLAVADHPYHGINLIAELVRVVDQPHTHPVTTTDNGIHAANIKVNTGERVVLYIEDNESNLRLVENVLKHHVGVRVIGASEPFEGLALARAYRPDLILVDINLPGIDGYEVLRQLQADPSVNDPHIIAVSASAAESDITRGLTAGFERYITKPINVTQFVKTVNGLLDEPPTSPPLARAV
ncbi:MAG: response regulator [Pseudomonadota bacterium]